MAQVGTAPSQARGRAARSGQGRPDDGTAGGVRWPGRVGLSLSFLGFGVAGYLTFEHFTSSSTLSCPATGGIVNCLKVTTSVYSEIHGVPVAVLGLAFFTVMLALQTPAAWRSQDRRVRGGRVLWSLLGMGTALWLIYAELFRIGSICLWCTAVHILSFALLVTTLFGTTSTLGAEEI